MKTAFITGIFGQDGAYLAEFLLKKGYKVIGGSRRSARSGHNRLALLGIDDKIEIVDFDLLEQNNINRVIQKYKPDEFYNLAAQSFVATSFDQPLVTFDINARAVVSLLEAIKDYSPETKFYQASTSEMFGEVREVPQNENTPFYPRSPYATAKLAAHWAVKNYRESYKLFAVSGILFNHESALRGDEFVTKKIINYVRKEDFSQPLLLGNLEARRDWGFAKDYVRAMWIMLQNLSPVDYVVATGETHTVKEFVDEAFAHANIVLHWEGEGQNMKAFATWDHSNDLLVQVDSRFFRPNEVNLLQGDASKIKKELGWDTTITFTELVEEMFYQYSLSNISN